MNHVITWRPGMKPLGTMIVAIGVFDGVHLGHQALLRDAAKDAMRRDAHSVALTFDRDPDQVVTPDQAAAQLLTLEEKVRLIRECGISYVLVVPFTSTLAAMSAESFLDEVLAPSGELIGIHVGENFRFGARATGDLDTLYVWGVEHNVDVKPHSLLEVDGGPVTSTRIRALVADGDVTGAASLLGRPTRVTGTVHRGRGEGAQLGFPTANVDPVPYAAIPANGVYAGRALLGDGRSYHAAIVVGRPPSFPAATDFLEVHLIGFEGDLYGAVISVEFCVRLRDQRSFESLDALVAAITADVARASEEMAVIDAATSDDAENDWVENPFTVVGERLGDIVETFVGDSGDYYDDEDVVEDPQALLAAERAVAGIDPMDAYDETDEEWVQVVEPRHLSGLYSAAGVTAMAITGPLSAAGIPFAWDPYPPEQAPSFRPGYGAIDRPYSLLVPASRAGEARQVLSEYERHLRLRTRPVERMFVEPEHPGPIVETEPVKSGTLVVLFAVLIAIPLALAVFGLLTR